MWGVDFINWYIHTQIIQPHRDFEVRLIHQRDDHREQHLWHVTKPESVAPRFEMRVPPVLQCCAKEEKMKDSVVKKIVLFARDEYCIFIRLNSSALSRNNLYC